MQASGHSGAEVGLGANVAVAGMAPDSIAEDEDPSCICAVGLSEEIGVDALDGSSTGGSFSNVAVDAMFVGSFSGVPFTGVEVAQAARKM